MIEWYEAVLLAIFWIPMMIVGAGYVYGMLDERFGQEPAEENVTNE